MQLSRSEAVQFVEGRLAIKSTELRLSENKASFLDDLIVAFHRYMPFQTLSNMAIPPELRDVPTWEQVKEDMFSGRGGLCFSLNYFACELLRSFGYSVFLAYGMTDVQKHNVHAIVIVENLVRFGDKHLVDVGFGYATLRAVTLDFEKESPLFEDSFQPYKYVVIEESPSDCAHRKFARLHKRVKNNDPRHFPVVIDGWAHAYHFTLEPHSVDRLRQMFAVGIYKNMYVPASRTFRVVHWVEGRAIAVRNNTLLREEESLEDGAWRLIATILETDEEIISAVCKEFPEFDEQLIRRAITIWRSLPDI